MPRRLRITDNDTLRARAMAFYAMRLDGKTDAEIGKFFGRGRQYVNAHINALTAEQKAGVRAKRMQSIRADDLLRAEEFADALA